MFVDYDDICRDPWSINQPEAAGDGGRQCVKQSGAVTGWEDSDDDGVPDYVDLAAVGGPVMADCDSDSDKDSIVDAIEAAPHNVRPCAPTLLTYGQGTDPLDASSPAGGPVGGIAEPPQSESGAATGSACRTSSVLAIAGAAATFALAVAFWQAGKRWGRSSTSPPP
jgi:hypothetical protein